MQAGAEIQSGSYRFLDEAASFADIHVELNTSGGLAAIFSDFEIEGDLESIRQHLGFSAALELSGSIRFAPNTALAPRLALLFFPKATLVST